MKKLLSLFILSIFTVLTAQKKPKLVIGIVVDQMRTEYLYRFDNHFSDSGFKKFQREGFSFWNVHYNYIPTYTGPGHASIYTGTTPKSHGIVGNHWFHKQKKEEVYCTDDANVTIIGNGKKKEGKMSPKNLKTTTITDELALATNFDSKIIGISIKDRGAILPAGHFADGAYWMASNGEFISSSYYYHKLPDWVTDFNNSGALQEYLSKTWNPLFPLDQYKESYTKDDNIFESKLNGKNTAFPYNLQEISKEKGPGIIKYTPYGNSILLDFAKKAIENEEMGQDRTTDFLTLSFSSTDYLGHAMGTRAHEIQDMYIRLDREIAELFKYLDTNIGKDQYIVFLTADHAAADNPKYLNRNGYSAQSLNKKEITADLENISTQLFGQNVILNYSNQNIYLNQEKLNQLGVEKSSAIKKIQNSILELGYVKDCFSYTELQLASDNKSIEKLLFNGFDRKQNGDLYVLYYPQNFEYGPTGTSHGSGYQYDTWVPLLWYGKDIPKGKSFNYYSITSIAPTLSQILQINYPNGSHKELLTEILHDE